MGRKTPPNGRYWSTLAGANCDDAQIHKGWIVGLQDRDYMRSGGGDAPRLKFPDMSPGPWWRRIKWQASLAIALSVVAVASGVVWLVRDTRVLFGPSAPTEASLIVNINTATHAEIETLPGIGPAKTLLIIRDRSYARVDDLLKVNGIGAELLQDIRPYVVVDGQTRSIE